MKLEDVLDKVLTTLKGELAFSDSENAKDELSNENERFPPTKRRKLDESGEDALATAPTSASNRDYYSTSHLALFQRLFDELSKSQNRLPKALAIAEELLEAEWVAMHSVYYKDVTPAMHRAFLDAALAKAVCQCLVAESSKDPLSIIEASKHALETLDRALIMVGRARPDRLLDTMIEALDHAIGEEPSTERGKSFTIDQPAEDMKLAHPVRRLDHPMTLAAFVDHLDGPSCEPFVVSGCLDHWPALSNRSWTNLAYFESLVGRHRIVPVEIGSRYTDDDWSQKLMTFGAFLDDYIFTARQNYSARNDIEITPAYLAQHNLLDQIPRMHKDIAVPDYVHARSLLGLWDNDADPIINLWFGPADTVSPAHTDPHHNLYAQVLGYKFLRLFPPSETPRLYPLQGIMNNTSRVDVEDPDLDEFPDFGGAKSYDVIVGPGDLLFIPVGWWHHVRSLTVSCSISFWFD